MQACIARQPIFNPGREVVAYELLFRSGPENIFCGADGDLASASVMGDALHVHQLSSLCDGKPCFINITRKVLVQDLYTILPTERVVLELLEDIQPDEEVIAACQRLRRAGYSLALDDVSPKHRLRDSLLPYAQIVKVDFLASDMIFREEIAQLMKKTGVELLAEKVETYTDFAEAKRMGYSRFQGFFFCRPEMVTRRDVPPARLAQVRLLQQINLSDLDIDALDALVRQDTALAYRLLRFLNSAAFGFRSEIKSIRHALVLLGDRPLRKWVSLMALSRLGEEKPTELITLSMVRARFCETLGRRLDMADRDSDLFMLGMFSLLDAVLDRPMVEVLKDMALSDEVRAGLLRENPTLHDVLELSIAFERAEWEEFARRCHHLRVAPGEAADAHHRASKWAAGLFDQVCAPPAEQAKAA
jgi:c-di-GMP-related signal transduction protein